MLKKIKIAVICENPHYILGGIENYNALCYEDWTKNYDVTEFPFIKDEGKRKIVREKNLDVKIDYKLTGWKPNLMVWGGIYTRKKMNEIYKNFDVIILNTSWIPKKWLKNNKTILVQHNDLQVYCWQWKNRDYFFAIGLLINSLLFNVNTITNPFKKAKNLVFYCKESNFNINQKNISYIPLAHKNKQDLITNDNLLRKNFMWIGRLENKQKNIVDLVKLANLNSDIYIYGLGKNINIIDKKLVNKKQYQGLLLKNEINDKLKKMKALIFTSKYDGLPFVVVEALSNGTPVILFDTFDTAKFLAKSGAVFLVQKNNIEEFNQKINWIRNMPLDEYQKISNNALSFAREYLSKEIFWENWNKMIKKTTEQNLTI